MLITFSLIIIFRKRLFKLFLKFMNILDNNLNDLILIL
jgi:hypothetical protein